MPEYEHACGAKFGARKRRYLHCIEQVYFDSSCQRWIAESPGGDGATEIRYCPWCGKFLTTVEDKEKK
jgi:hypothetical protein